MNHQFKNSNGNLRPNFRQTAMPIQRTIRCWTMELNNLLKSCKFYRNCEETKMEIPEEELIMYYNGGYSPKNTILSYFRIPVEMDMFSC